MNSFAYKIDIIVCVHNALPDVKSCLASIKLTLSTDHRLIIVDDCSEQETALFLKNFVSRNKKGQVILIVNDTNLGYTKSANIGLRRSEAPFVVLLNSDVLVTMNWADKLRDMAESIRGCGIIGPISNAAGWQSVPLLIGHQSNSFIINELPRDVNAEFINRKCEELASVAYTRVPLVNGFCLGIKRDVIEKIGYFDEGNFPVGFGEEDDYCIRAVDAGFTNIIAINTYIQHGKSKSFGHQRRKAFTMAGREKLNKLHGKDRLIRLIKTMRRNRVLAQTRTMIQDVYDQVSFEQVRTRGLPLVSVCIPTYNGEQFLTEALESVRNQTYQNIEIIISDDESSDATLKIAEHFAKSSRMLTRIINHKRSTIGANWNNCVKNANGKYIKFLFQDDLLESTCIEKMTIFLENNEHIPMVFCKRSILLESDSKFKINTARFDLINDLQRALDLDGSSYHIFGKDLFRREDFLKSPLNKIGEPTVTLIRKTIFDEIGYFDENLYQILDYSYWYRILLKYRVALLNRVLIKFRVHEAQATAVNERNGHDDSWFYQKFLFKDVFPYLTLKNKAKVIRNIVVGSRLRLERYIKSKFLYRPIDKVSVTLCCIVKDEDRYLLEWIAYHKLIGFENIVIYSHDSTDNTNNILHRLQAKGEITYKLWPDAPGASPQASAYNDLILTCQTEWAVFIDVDEFIVLNKHENIREFLYSVGDNISAVAMNWRVFGSGGQDEIYNGLVIERYRTCSKRDFSVNGHYKSIVRVKKTSSMGAHRAILKSGLYTHPSGKQMTFARENNGKTDRVEHSVIQINHYVIKSKEDYIRKSKKGSVFVDYAHPQKYSRFIDKNSDFFKRHDKNEELDETIQPFVPLVRDEMRRLEKIILDDVFA